MNRRRNIQFRRRLILFFGIVIICLTLTGSIFLSNYYGETMNATSLFIEPPSGLLQLLPSSLLSSARETSSQKTTQCQPHTKIAFMKTHKTASSTVQSVLFRFGLDNKLNFVLPSDGNHLNDPSHRFILTENFKTEWLDQEKEKIPWHETLYKEKKYDIFNLHTVWNQTATRDLLGPDAVYVTILRHPVDLFESLYAYTNFQTVLKLNLHEYIQSLNVSETLYQHRINQYMGLNQQLYDLGLPLVDLYKLDAIKDRIKEMEKEFDLVLFSEMFDESMVLLADKLCWPLDYVKSFKLNARKAAYKVTLNKQERKTLEAWQNGDLLLYNHFKQIFQQKVTDYGDAKMTEDVKILQELNQEAKERCLISETDREHMDRKSLYRPFSHEVVAYKINQDDHECRLLGMAENALVDLARARQKFRWDTASNSAEKNGLKVKP